MLQRAHGVFVPVSTVDRPFGLGPRELITSAYDLPCPPSVNRTRRMHGPGARLLQSWKDRAGMHIIAMGRRRQIPGPFEARITFGEGARLDLDNGVKALIDLARWMRLIVDDDRRYLRRLVVEWGHAPEGCRLELIELAEPAA